ncbi:HTH-type transcriptional regulator DmlR [Pseudomonas sp. URMO17WK12:I11]|nr:HTH-type transcriptional regulator DmlR [Pseudomonas sp. URMO17WK12:I11]
MLQLGGHTAPAPMNMLDNLCALKIFARAAQTLGFTEVGNQLGLSSSAIGKAVARLEQRLGVRLFHRSTRGIQLTDEGQQVLDACQRMFNELETMEAELAQSRVVPRGRPAPFARRSCGCLSTSWPSICWRRPLRQHLRRRSTFRRCGARPDILPCAKTRNTRRPRHSSPRSKRRVPPYLLGLRGRLATHLEPCGVQRRDKENRQQRRHCEPPMIAIAIGPQNTLRVSGTMASTVASAVSMTGRAR